MAKKPSKNNGEPPRKNIPQQKTKPLLVVADADDLPVMEGRHYLAWHKATGMFYVGGTGESWDKSNLKTRDRFQAMFRFREWVRCYADDPDKLYIAVEHEPHLHPEIALPERIRDILEDREFIRYDIPSADFWRLVRELALTDPESFRKETGLCIVDEQPKASVGLSKILDFYMEGDADSKKKRGGKKPKGETISPDEQRKVKRYWAYFAKQVSPAKTVADVDDEAITRFEDAVWEIMEDGSPKTADHYFEYPMRLLRYAHGKKIDSDECSRVRDALKSGKSDLPPANSTDSQPIPLDVFHRLLDVADLKWKAILLTALNLCYYGCDVRRLPKSSIDWNNGWVIFDRIKAAKGERKPVARVGILWDRTKQALLDYLESSGHQGEEVFITQYRRPYTSQGLRTAFRFLREEKAGLGKTVELAHIRDGAYTAAVQGGAAELHCKILAGHKVDGMTDAYIKRNPAMVADATESIEAIYFPPETEPETDSESETKPETKSNKKSEETG